MKSKKPYSRVYLEITNICNRSCSFCHGTKRSPRTMSLDEVREVATSLVPLTDYIYLHVMGEPTIHRDISEIIRSITSLGFHCAVTTNGTLLSRVGQSLIDAGVYKVNVSVHSFEDGEDSAYFGYLADISEFADRASRSGVLVVLRLWNKGVDGGRNDTTLDYFKQHLQGEWTWGARGARIRDKLHLEYGDRFEWPDISLPDGTDHVFCYGLSDHFGILCDGSVIPCCLDGDGEINLGNIFNEDIGDILASKRAQDMVEGFRSRHASEPLCRRCGYARRFK